MKWLKNESENQNLCNSFSAYNGVMSASTGVAGNVAAAKMSAIG
jgi:hypothetical protein